MQGVGKESRDSLPRCQQVVIRNGRIHVWEIVILDFWQPFAGRADLELKLQDAAQVCRLCHENFPLSRALGAAQKMRCGPNMGDSTY